MLIDINDLGLSEEELYDKYVRSEQIDTSFLFANPDGQTTFSQVDKPLIPAEKIRKTYKQNWSYYYAASRREKLMFYRILKDATDYLMVEYHYQGNGRPPVYLANIIKALCIKAYHNSSSWRVESELKIAKAMGIIDEIPKRSTINKYLKNKKVSFLLDRLYKIIAEPLSEVEIYFSADATGISNKYGNNRWRLIRHTKEEMKKTREYSKLHIISGTKTNVIASAEITTGNMHESPLFKPLLKDTIKIFTIKELSADAGYLSKDNVNAISKIGAQPFIMPKRNVNVPMKGRISAWGGMLRLWKENQMIFAEHYHRRSNVESTFSALKRKFGDFTRSKLETSQRNDILSKIVCFNTVTLAEAILENNLETGFLKSL
jgi:transposase